MLEIKQVPYSHNWYTIFINKIGIGYLIKNLEGEFVFEARNEYFVLTTEELEQIISKLKELNKK